MWRIAFRFLFGMTAALLPVDLLSVYLFHDVDKDRAGRLNLAFLELCEESIIFALTVTALFFFFLWCGRALLRTAVPHSNHLLAFLLGISLIVVQYPMQVVSRVAFPSRQDVILGVYILLSPMFCAGILLTKSRNKLRQIAQPQQPFT